MTAEELKVIIRAETAGFQSELNKVKSQINSTKSAAGGLGKTLKTMFAGISFAYIVRQLMNVGKEAINMASDLQEVQNVVDVSFGSMSREVDKFTKNAITKFGMSELSAKQYASTFMAMGNGMQIASRDGKDMALTLTGLTGDLASFYNVSQDVAATALNSIYTGETESLKKFGIVMTEANLQQFAYNQGISTSISNMSQAEKVALRYNYVMQATANAQGDFARTSGSWANQVRILKEQWKSFLGIVGNGLMQALSPVVKVLNQILSYFISIGNAIAKTFGGKAIKNSSANVSDMASGLGGISDDLGGAASGAGDLADGMNGASKAAEKLKRQTMGFDELNIMASQSTGSSGGSGGSGGGGSGGGGLGGSGGGGGISTFYQEDVEETESTFDGLSEKLKSFVDSLPELKINFNKEEALADLEQIKSNLATTAKTWAHTILSISIKILNDLDVGELANKLLKLTTSFTGLVATISEVVTPCIERFYDEAISPIVQWIGGKLADALDFASGELDKWAKWFEDNKESFENFTSTISDTVQALWDIIKPLADSAWETAKNIISDLGDVARDFFKWILDNSDGIVIALEAIVGAFIAYKAALAISSLIEAIRNGTALLTAVTWLQTAAQTALNLVMSLNPIALVVAAIAGLVIGFVALWKKSESFRNFWKGLWEKIKKAAKAVADWFVKAWTDVGKFFTETIPNKFKEGKEKIVNKFTEIKDKVHEKVDSLKTGIKNKFEEIKTGMAEKIENAKTAVKDKFEQIKTGMTEKVESAKTAVKNKFDEIKSGISEKVTAVKTKVTDTFNAVKTAITSPVEKARDAVKTVIDKIKGFFHFTWSLPKLKVPKFSITPSGWKVRDLLEGSIPKLGVTWNAKGGIFDKATLLGVGEAGKEAILPLERNTGWMDILASKINKLSGNNNNTPTITKLVLNVDGKELANTTIKNINELTKQSGTLQLVLI